MKPEQITAVANEMRELFIEYSMQHNSITSNGKPLEMQLAAVSELQRKQAMTATNIVVKHCHWPETLSDQLKRVVAYIEANPERTVSHADTTTTA